MLVSAHRLDTRKDKALSIKGRFSPSPTADNPPTMNSCTPMYNGVHWLFVLLTEVST